LTANKHLSIKKSLKIDPLVTAFKIKFKEIYKNKNPKKTLSRHGNLAIYKIYDTLTSTGDFVSFEQQLTNPMMNNSHRVEYVKIFFFHLIYICFSIVNHHKLQRKKLLLFLRLGCIAQTIILCEFSNLNL
jgi:hypothetical protein